jgi:hypothetical protein
MTLPTGPANDPDRYDPSRDEAARPETSEGPLDPALDPDRFDPTKEERPPLVLGRTGGPRSTLPELIGKDASFQDSPSPYIWVLGLIGIAAFLLVFAFVFSHLGP